MVSFLFFHIAEMMGYVFGLATFLAFLVGFFIFVAKIIFVQRVIAAKADVNIFNYTLALSLVASGKRMS